MSFRIGNMHPDILLWTSSLILYFSPLTPFFHPQSTGCWQNGLKCSPQNSIRTFSAFYIFSSPHRSLPPWYVTNISSYFFFSFVPPPFISISKVGDDNEMVQQSSGPPYEHSPRFSIFSSLYPLADPNQEI